MDFNIRIKEILQHRPPMSWIDQIIFADPSEFITQSLPKSEISFFSTFPAVHLIELGAQSFAWFMVHRLLSKGQKEVTIKAGFLTSIDSFEVENESRVAASPYILSKIKLLNDVHPLYVVGCEFVDHDGFKLGEARLKIYGEVY